VGGGGVCVSRSYQNKFKTNKFQKTRWSTGVDLDDPSMIYGETAPIVATLRDQRELHMMDVQM
jgi:hypothetical protein